MYGVRKRGNIVAEQNTRQFSHKSLSQVIDEFKD